MKKIVAALLIMVLCVGVIGNNAYAVKSDDNESIKSVIENYYSSSYDMWWNLKMGDLSKYLDMNSIQSYNKTVFLQNDIETWKYLIEKGYFTETRERNEVNFDFKAINVTGDTADVTVVMSGKTSTPAVYPEFVILGENTFKLTKISNRWLITEQNTLDPNLYNLSKTEKLELNTDKMKKKIDTDLSISLGADANNSSTNLGVIPATAYAYNSSRAATYGYAYYISGNTKWPFYNPDCTNFVSQCVSYGFGTTTQYDLTTSYAFDDVWNPWVTKWTSASQFWDYAMSSKTNGLHVVEQTLSTCQTGTVMQVDWYNGLGWSHSTMCVSGSGANSRFAQHSSNALYYYAAYSSYGLRFMYPVGFWTQI